MTKAAGTMFVTPDGDVLFLKRGAGSDHVGAWCFPGGVIEDGESADEAASREAMEELGAVPDGPQHRLAQNISDDGVDFTTFVKFVPEKFEPTINEEHTDFSWAPMSEPPDPLHPGVEGLLNDMEMAEDDGGAVPDNEHVIHQKTGVDPGYMVKDEEPWTPSDRFYAPDGAFTFLDDDGNEIENPQPREEGPEEVSEEDAPATTKTIHVYQDG